MTLAIVDEARPVTGGVDTHADAHVAAALDGIGGLLGVQEFAATPAGYARLLGWLRGFGTVGLVGIEGTGSYGAGLARHITAAGIRVVEVDRSDRQDRRRHGKSDPLDAVSAARAALSGRAAGAPRGRDGQVEAIRALMVAKRTARAQRTQTINQTRALIITGPDDYAPGSPGRPWPGWSRSWPRCGPGRAAWCAITPCWRCASSAAAPSTSTASSPAWCEARESHPGDAALSAQRANPLG